ncbi:MAG: DUF1566 domain-containing protein [Rhodospirillales bacterium]|nr:DUF1566 domain-containing protein [Rhodospirillales bacterium]
MVTGIVLKAGHCEPPKSARQSSGSMSCSGLLRSLCSLAMTVVVMASSAPAYAACTNPAGTESQIIYHDDENVLQYCDGTNWQGMNRGVVTASSGCSNPARYEGAIVYNSDFNVVQLCSGNQWVALGKINAAAGSGGCSNPAGNEGEIVYNDDVNVMQYCDGSAWRPLYGGGKENGCTNIGDVCADGTVYAGLSGASTPMFVTRCDAGMSWGGASCTGTRLTLSWNNGNNAGYVLTGANTVDGKTNTATIVTFDSDTGVTGMQQHQAAQYCADLVANGYSDWFLPSMAELTTLYSNRVAIGGFDLVGNTYNWASTENADFRACAIKFTDGYAPCNQGENVKYYARTVRCARR